MDLNLVATFEAVARTGSFSGAARALGMPKSSVSRSVARLEAELGVQLLFRTTRQVSLTAPGTALYDRVSPLLASMRGALGEVPAREVQPSGELRLTAPPDASLFLGEVVARYVARWPEVRVDVHLTGRVVDLVGEGFDAALRAGASLEDSSLVARKVLPVAMQLYASPVYLARRGTPRSEAELAQHDRVVFRSGPEKLRVKRRPGGDGEGRIVSDDLLFVREAVRAGAGIGMLPTFVAEPELASGTLVRVLPRTDVRAGFLWFVTPAAKHVPSKVTAFRDLLAEVLRAPARAALG